MIKGNKAHHPDNIVYIYPMYVVCIRNKKSLKRDFLFCMDGVLQMIDYYQFFIYHVRYFLIFLNTTRWKINEKKQMDILCYSIFIFELFIS